MNKFRDTLKQKDFVVTATLPLRPSTTVSDIRAAVDVLGPYVDAIQIADDRYGVGQMSVLAAASIVMRCGLDAVVQMSCRDRNRVALVADILGAAALEISTLIVARGEKFSRTAPMRSKGVFEIGATGLIEIASAIGEDKSLVAAPGLLVGSFVTVFRPDPDWEAGGVKEKLDKGAKLLQTQPCLNAGLLRSYVKELVERKITHRTSIVVDVPLLTSLAEASTLKEAFTGSPIPDAVVQRIAGSSNPASEGSAVCAEIIAEIKTIPGVSGVNVQHPGAPANVAAALRLATGA